jgi:mRNA interferase RelE/StbE
LKPILGPSLKETEYYRIRAGAYRVVYAVSDADKRVKVLSIGHRREIYR